MLVSVEKNVSRISWATTNWQKKCIQLTSHVAPLVLNMFALVFHAAFFHLLSGVFKSLNSKLQLILQINDVSFYLIKFTQFKRMAP